MPDGWTQCEHFENGERCGFVAYNGHTHCPEHATHENADAPLSAASDVPAAGD